MLKEPTRKILLTGDQGCGKTTVVKEVIELLHIQGVGIRGFFTEPTNASEVGYNVVTMSGIRVTFAHVDLRRGPYVGAYHVDIDAFEEAALGQLHAPGRRTDRLDQVVVIDEVGPLQCLSDRFLDRVTQLLESPAWVLATVPLSGGPFIEFLHSWARDRIIRVTPDNRDKLPDRIVDALLLA